MRRSLVLLSIACAAGTAGAQGTTEVYLQRGADGRAVFTDKPRQGVVVEKMWRLEREDPEAARERAAEVRREAAATSARVQRSIDAEQDRLALADRQRARARADEAERQRLADLRAESERPVVVAPWLGAGVPQWQFGPQWQPDRPPRARPPGERPEPPRRRPTGSTAPASTAPDDARTH